VKSFFVRITLTISIMGMAYFAQQISELHLKNWIYYDLSADLELYGRWQVISLVLLGLGVISLIWSWFSIRKD
jgi:hypothetical protein